MLCVVVTVVAITALASSQIQPPLPDPTADAAALLAERAAAQRWTPEDWDIFESKVRFATEERLEEAELGEAIVRLAASFVGTTYTPGTLEADGPEGLVINFRELDCVTFVETVLALTRFIRLDGAALLEDPAAARAKYEAHLTDLRYRGGVIDGYPSRLHYFSEWLTDNEAGGLVRVATVDLDPSIDTESIRFMSTHPDAYRQLGDPEVLRAIVEMEDRLNEDLGRSYVPEERIAEIAGRIRDGDVIAATSTAEGLDVAHTGFAMWRDGQLYLLHAPLVGEEVQISVRPLADRIASFPTQDGIMVGRPTEPPR